MSQGYGVDTWCDSHYQPGRLVRGARAVALSLFRRFTTPKGMLRGDDTAQDFGFDLEGYVGSVSTDLAVASLPALVRAEAQKDDRVARVDVRASASTSAAGLVSIILELTVYLADGSASFPLTLSASAVGVSILGSLPA